MTFSSGMPACTTFQWPLIGHSPLQRRPDASYKLSGPSGFNGL